MVRHSNSVSIMNTVPSLPDIPNMKFKRMEMPYLGRRSISTNNFPPPLIHLRRPPPPLRLCMRYIRRSSLFLSVYLLVYTGYLVGGAFVFSCIEAPAELRERALFRQAIQHFRQEYQSVPEEALEKLINSIVDAGSRGVPVTRNASGDSNWSFGQAFFFAGTVVTTIGYGHVTPSTEGGKMFTMLYGIVGIPMTLVFFSSIVDRLMVPASAFLRYLSHRFGNRGQLKVQCLHLLGVFIILLSFFFLLPAAIFNYLEDGWGYLDSLYYCFISLTTVGLGDYIPGDGPDQTYRSLYKIITTVYLLSGLVAMVLVLNIFYEIPQLNVGNMFLLKSDEYFPDDVEHQPLIIERRKRNYGSSARRSVNEQQTQTSQETSNVSSSSTS